MAKKDKKIVATVLYSGMTALDLIGSSQALMGPDLRSLYQTVKVAECMDPVRTDTALMVVPNQTFGELPAPYCLIVPGGEAALTAGHNEALLRYVRTAAHAADYVVSTGTGSLILGAAGLLKGRHATTHWAYAKHLKEYGSHYTRKRWVEDGKIITAAGVSAGIDMALFLAARLTDQETMRIVQLDIEYDPQRPFGSIDWTQVGFQARFMRAMVSLIAPFITLRPKRLTRRAGLEPTKKLPSFSDSNSPVYERTYYVHRKLHLART